MTSAPRYRIVHCFRSPVGGIFRHVRDLAEAQVAAGHEVGMVLDSSTGGAYEDCLLDAIADRFALGVKRIPMQAGMGGGSSDAAATLVGLNQFWGCDLTSEKLHMLAAELGSDVNFFLDSPIAAVCRGRGEVIEPVRLSRRFHAVVACPSSGLSTANVFRAWASERQRHASVTSFVSQMQRGTLSQHDIHNALERPARELNGDVARTLDSLRRIANGPVGMSGSGTSCFVLCRTAREAGVIAGRLSFDRSLRVFPVSSRV